MLDGAKLRVISMFHIRLVNNSKTWRVKSWGKAFKMPALPKNFVTLVLAALFMSGCQSISPGKISIQDKTTGQSSGLPNSAQAIRYEKAVKHLQTKEYNAAESILTELSEQRPNFAGSWVNLGLIKLMTKKPTEAKAYVERALALIPKHPQALNLMGLIATHDRDIKLAEQYYLKAIENSKQYANAHYNLALLYDVYLQDIRSAVEHYQNYLRYTQVEDQQTQSWVEHLQSSLSN